MQFIYILPQAKEEFGRVAHDDSSKMSKLEQELNPILLESRTLKSKSFHSPHEVLRETKRRWQELESLYPQSDAIGLSSAFLRI